MPNSTVQISATFDESQLSSSLDRAIKQGIQKGFQGINATGVGNPFGKLTSGAKDFDTTLASVNRRVLGFGVSLGLIGGAVRTFKDLVNVTLDVDKSLAKIQSVMALTGRQVDALSRGLFDVARRTGETFDEVAKGFEQASKAGGSFEQVMRRTQVAASLAKVGNIEVAESVKGLTAAFNTFGRAGETWVSIANKISAANRAFPVEVKDIIGAIGSFGTEAQDAGVSLNKLIGMVAALKATTGRDGPAIAQSLQRVFARLEQNTGKLGGIIDTTQAKNGLQILTQIAAKYKDLTDIQRKAVAQSVVGIFSPNTSKALLKDLADANGIAARTAALIEQSTNDLNTRLALQNNNLSQSIQNLKTSASQVGSILGNLTLKPALNGLLGSGNLIAGALQGLSPSGATKPGEDFGKYFGESVLKGIGNVLAGPGLVALFRVAAGAIARTVPEVIKDAKQTFGFSGPQNQDQNVLKGINTLLSVGTEQENARYRAAVKTSEQEAVLLGILERQATVMQRIQGEQAAAQLIGIEGGLLSRERLATIGRGNAAGGYIPAVQAENAAISQGIGGAPSSARSVMIPHFAYGGGATGPIVANTSEFMVHGAGGSAIYNRDMIKAHGLPPGATPIAAGGYVPNAAGSFQPGSLKTSDPYFGGLKATPYDIANINSLFNSLSKAQNLTHLNEVGDQIIRFSDSLDKLSKRKVLDQLAVGFKEARTQIEGINAAQQKPIQDFLSAVRNPPKPQGAGWFLSPEHDKVDAEIQARLQSESGYAEYVKRVQQVRAAPIIRHDVPDDFIGPRSGEFFTRQRAAAAESLYPPISRSIPGISTSGGGGGLAAALSQVRRENAQRRLLGSSALADQERAQRSAAIGNRVGQALLFASFGSAFIPEGVGGTHRGQAFGAASGALQGAGFGSALGSIVGPEGTVVGGALGALVGGGLGAFQKRSKSASEIGDSLRDVEARNDQILRGSSEYVSGLSALREAAASGASPGVIRTLSRRTQESLAGIGDSGVVAKLTGAGINDDKLRDAQSSILDQVGASRVKTGALVSSAAFGANANSDTSQNAAESFAALFSGQKVNLRALNTGGKEFDLAKIGQALGRNGKLDTGQINDYLDQLGKVDIESLTDFLGRAAEAFDKNKDSIEKAGQISSTTINYGDVQKALGEEIDFLEQAIVKGAGMAEFLRRQGSQRVSAASRILGEGRLASSRGRSLSGVDLENSFQLSQAQQESSVSNAAAFATARRAFATTLQGSGLGVDDLHSINTGILGAQSPNDLRDLKGNFNDAQQKALEKVVQTLETTVHQNDLNLQLVKEQVALQKLEVQATQHNQLLRQGGFSQGTLSTFSGSANTAATPLSSSLFSNLGVVNAALGQSQLLDQLGLPKGPQSQRYQDYLREQSVRGTLSTLAARKLGTAVRPDTLGLTDAAAQLSNRGSSSDIDLSDRILKSVSSLQFSPQKAARRVLGGASGGTNAIGARDLSTLVGTGQLSVGEGGIVSGVNQSNRFLKSIDDHIGDLVKQQTELTAIAADREKLVDPSLSDSQKQVVRQDLASRTARLAAASGGGSGIAVSLFHRATEDGLGLDEDPSKPFSFKGDKPVSPLSSFGSGFTEQLSSLKTAMNGFREVGAETANTLTQSFSSFFGNFVTGTERGNVAFKGFVASTLASVSKLFADNAVKSIFGAIGGAFDPANRIPSVTDNGGNGPDRAMGGYIGMANGGKVPTMLTGGEVVISPQAAARIGRPALDALNQGRVMGYAGGGSVATVRGGSGIRDDVPALLQRGSYVIKRSSAQRLGAGYIGAMANGGYLNRTIGGDIAGLFGSGGVGGYGLEGALIGGILGAVLNSRNRGKGALVGAGLGLGAGLLGNLASGNSVFGGTGSGLAAASGGGAQSISKELLTKLSIAGITGYGAQAITGRNKTLDTLGIENNARALVAEQQGVINNRTPGTFIDLRQGANGQYNIIDAGGPLGSNGSGAYGNPAAREFFAGYGSGNTATPFGYAGGGSVGDSDMSYTPISSSRSGAPVQANVTIHNYGNGQTSSSATTTNGDPSSAFGGQDFANRLNKFINAAVQEQMVQASRGGGWLNTNQRYSPNNFTG